MPSLFKSLWLYMYIRRIPDIPYGPPYYTTYGGTQVALSGVGLIAGAEPEILERGAYLLHANAEGTKKKT